MKILLVDDDRSVRETLAQILEIVVGCEVRSVDSAEAALELVAAGVLFDLLLTDMQMPGLNGGELVASLRALGHGQPMYVMTGLVRLPEIAGATGVIGKPIRIETLENIIKAHS